MKKLCLMLALAGATILPAHATEPIPDATAQIDKAYLYEVMRHLYRWYMDESDIEKVASLKDVTFRVRPVHPKLDAGDRSELAEITFVDFGVSVQVKKANYTIEELAAVISNDTFKITRVSRDVADGDGREVKADYAEMRDYLFRTRKDAQFPEGELLMRMRLAARKELKKHIESIGAPMPEGVQVIHLAPLSPVANEAWVLWESGRILIRFASDIDLANPEVWEHEDLAVRIYDIERQVVVSLDEVPGSNAFMTRDQVGRALYNCIILGKRIEVNPKEAEAAETQADASR
jgi:hypothetical protein